MNRKTLIITLSAIGVVALVSTGAWLGYQALTQRSVSTDSQTTAMVQTPQTPSSQSSTKEFRDSQLPQFTFTYPTDWTLEVKNVINGDEERKTDPQGKGMFDGELRKEIAISKDSHKLMIDLYSYTGPYLFGGSCYDKQFFNMVNVGNYIAVINTDPNYPTDQPVTLINTSNLLTAQDKGFDEALTKAITSADNKNKADYLYCEKDESSDPAVKQTPLKFTNQQTK